MKIKLKPVTSLAHLDSLARQDENYASLMMIAARNLGGDGSSPQAALQTLKNNAMETDEEGVVDEVNACRDLVK